MKAITPEIFEAIEKVGNDHGTHNIENSVYLYTGRLSVCTYYSIFGSPAVDISERAKSIPDIPDDHIVIGVTRNYGGTGRQFDITNDGRMVHGVIGHMNATFHVISLVDLYTSDKTFFRIPSLSLKIGINKNEVDNAAISRITVDKNMPKENLVGKVIIPVVEEEDRGAVYYMNVIGETRRIPSWTTLESELMAGVYEWQGGGKHRYLGTIEEHLFKDKESLKRNVVLFTNKDEAGKYRDADAYYAALDAAAKAEQLARERELAETKSNTSQLDNESKVNVIKAKESYETNSVGRKDSLEETSYARSLTLGIAALATATVGVLAKVGLHVSTPELVLLSITPKAIIGGLLAGLFSRTTLGYKFTGALSWCGRVLGAVASGTVGYIERGVRAAIGGAVSVISGVFSGLGRLIGI